MSQQQDPYASEAKTAALLRPDTRTNGERQVDQLVEIMGGNEQGLELEARYMLLRQIAAHFMEKDAPVTAQHAAMRQAAFNAAIDFAIEQGPEAVTFLRCWREGDTAEWPEFDAPIPEALHQALEQQPADEPVACVAKADLKKLKDGDTAIKAFAPPATGDSEIALYTRPQPAEPAIPEGWKLVPVEPTERSLCRDCADFGPICPNSGKPCATTPAQKGSAA